MKLRKWTRKAKDNQKATRLDKLKQMDARQASKFIINRPWCIKFPPNCEKECGECLLKYLQEEPEDETN